MRVFEYSHVYSMNSTAKIIPKCIPLGWLHFFTVIHIFISRKTNEASISNIHFIEYYYHSALQIIGFPHKLKY